MRIKKIVIYLLIMLFLFQNSISRIVGGGLIESIDEIMVVIFFLWALIIVIQRKKVSKNVLTIFCLICAFSLIGIISCKVNSEFIISRVIVSNFLVIKFFILASSIAVIGFKDETRNEIISALEFWSKIVMIFAIFNFIMPEIYQKVCPFAIVTYRFGLVSVTSLFYHAGRYGWFMLFIALLHYSKYKSSGDKKEMKWMIICILFSLLSMRTKVISSIVIIAMYEAVANKKINIKKILIAIIVLLIMALTFKDVVYNTYILYFTNTEGVSARQALLTNSIEIIKDYFPLGVGFGKYGSWYARVYYSEYYYKYNMTKIYGLSPDGAFFGTDSFWSGIFGETGILGSVVYILLLLYIFKMLKEKNKGNKSIYVQWAILILIQTICESMGEPSFNSPPQNIFVAFVIGLALSNKKEKKEGNEKNSIFYA